MATHLKRRIVAALTAALLLFLLFLLFAGTASATHVDPVFLEGNENCTAVEGTTEILKLEDGNNLAAATFPAGGGSITISSLTDQMFDWSSTGVVISAVFVKAGDGGNLYNYLPAGETGDTGLTSPGGHAISHITFCTGGTTPTTVTTPPSETTTSPPDEVLPTEVTTTTAPDEVLPTEVTTTTAPDEVAATEVTPSTLPFTGAQTENLTVIALAFTGAGILFLVATRGLRKGRHEA
jgi:hypothetical protein